MAGMAHLLDFECDRRERDVDCLPSGLVGDRQRNLWGVPCDQSNANSSLPGISLGAGDRTAARHNERGVAGGTAIPPSIHCK